MLQTPSFTNNVLKLRKNDKVLFSSPHNTIKKNLICIIYTCIYLECESCALLNKKKMISIVELESQHLFLHTPRYLGRSVAYCVICRFGDCYTTHKLPHIISLMGPLHPKRGTPGRHVSTVACILQP